MLPTNPSASLKRRNKKNIPAHNQHFPGIVMPQELSAEEPTAQRGSSVLAASPGVQHTQEKGQNNKQKSFWPLLWAEPWISKASQQFLCSSPGTSAHFKSVVLIITHACVVREENSPALLRAGLTLPRQGSQPLDIQNYTHATKQEEYGNYGSTKASKGTDNTGMNAGIWPCCFLRSGCSSQEEWEKSTHRQQRQCAVKKLKRRHQKLLETPKVDLSLAKD